MENETKRVVRVVKLRLIKPLDRSWDELGNLLREMRHRAWLLANEYLTESAIAWHRKRAGDADAKPPSIDQLNQRLGERLRADPKCKTPPPAGAVNGYITGGLNQKLQALVRGHHWKSFVRGERALPTMRLNMPLPLRGGEGKFDPLHFSAEHNGYVFKPRIGQGQRAGDKSSFPTLLCCVPPRDSRTQAWLHNLATNPDQDEQGWRQRSFEISCDDSNRWWLHISFDKPATAPVQNPAVICRAVIDYEVPLTAWCGAAILGPEHTSALGHRIKQMRNVIGRRRREVQRGGKAEHARCGHGVTRKLAPTETLQGRIDRTQSSINHALSRMLVKFACDHEAGVIQLEDTTDLKDALKGTLLGTNWRYHDLHQMVEYKADEAGIKVEYVSGDDMQAATGFRRRVLESAA